MARKPEAGGTTPPAVSIGWRPGLVTITARYRELRHKLEAAVKEVDGGQDRLAGSLYCLVAVMDFLDADPAMAATMDTKLLGTLAHSIRDVLEGGKPELLFTRSDQPGRKGRPPNQSFASVQGTVAAALTLLIEAGDTRRSAGQFVASLLARYSVRHPDGKAISASQALRWRDEVGVRLPELATETCRDALNRYRTNAPPGLLGNLAACRDVAEGAIRATVYQGF